MLQIIGWMACLYLVVKGLEMFGRGKTVDYVGGLIAVAGAIVFVYLLQRYEYLYRFGRDGIAGVLGLRWCR